MATSMTTEEIDSFWKSIDSVEIDPTFKIKSLHKKSSAQDLRERAGAIKIVEFGGELHSREIYAAKDLFDLEFLQIKKQIHQRSINGPWYECQSTGKHTDYLEYCANMNQDPTFSIESIQIYRSHKLNTAYQDFMDCYREYIKSGKSEKHWLEFCKKHFAEYRKLAGTMVMEKTLIDASSINALRDAIIDIEKELNIKNEQKIFVAGQTPVWTNIGSDIVHRAEVANLVFPHFKNGIKQYLLTDEGADYLNAGGDWSHKSIDQIIEINQTRELDKMTQELASKSFNYMDFNPALDKPIMTDYSEIAEEIEMYREGYELNMREALETLAQGYNGISKYKNRFQLTAEVIQNSNLPTQDLFAMFGAPGRITHLTIDFDTHTIRFDPLNFYVPFKDNLEKLEDCLYLALQKHLFTTKSTDSIENFGLHEPYQKLKNRLIEKIKFNQLILIEKQIYSLHLFMQSCIKFGLMKEIGQVNSVYARYDMTELGQKYNKQNGDWTLESMEKFVADNTNTNSLKSQKIVKTGDIKTENFVVIGDDKITVNDEGIYFHSDKDIKLNTDAKQSIDYNKIIVLPNDAERRNGTADPSSTVESILKNIYQINKSPNNNLVGRRCYFVGRYENNIAHKYLSYGLITDKKPIGASTSDYSYHVTDECIEYINQGGDFKPESIENFIKSRWEMFRRNVVNSLKVCLKSIYLGYTELQAAQEFVLHGLLQATGFNTTTQLYSYELTKKGEAYRLLDQDWSYESINKFTNEYNTKNMPTTNQELTDEFYKELEFKLNELDKPTDSIDKQKNYVDLIKETAQSIKNLNDNLLNKIEEEDKYINDQINKMIKKTGEQDQQTVVKTTTYTNDDWLNDIQNQPVDPKPVPVEPTYIKRKPSFGDILADNAVSASYRVAATQVNNLAVAGIKAVLAKSNGGNTVESIDTFLSTEYGKAIISMMFGSGLIYIPQVQNDRRVQKLAEEMRINGMALAGNELLEDLMSHILPALTQTLNELPPIESATSLRLEETVELPETELESYIEEQGRQQQLTASI